MQATGKKAIVAGHLCLDIIPKFPANYSSALTAFLPGQLVNVEAATLSTGGAVSNTGISLNKLGITTRLLGKIGDDIFGSVVLENLRMHDPSLAEDVIISKVDSTSYTIVINPLNVDRCFFHFSGANDTYSSEDIQDTALKDLSLFHFGYPPLMRSMFAEEGKKSEILFQRVHSKGIATSLDMAMPDPQAESGKVNWSAWFDRVLPYVNVFLPSYEELRYMLGRDELHKPDAEILGSMANQLLRSGLAIVVIKLGEDGLYVKTSADKNNFQNLQPLIAHLDNWLDRELWVSCFKVDVVGTTGAGDATIAGFLAGMMNGLRIEKTMTLAVAAGACCVEAADAISGITTKDELIERVDQGWIRRATTIPLPEWTYEERYEVWKSPQDHLCLS